MHFSYSSIMVFWRYSEQAFDEIILNNPKIYDTDDATIELLIDSTLIINKCGVEGIGYGGKLKKTSYKI